MKALVGAFNQEKALVGAFSVIVQLHRLTDLRHYSPAVSRQQGWAALGTRPGYCGPTLQLQSENGVSMSIKLIKNISGEEEVELNHSL